MKFTTYSFLIVLFAIILFSCDKNDDEIKTGPDIRFVAGPNLITSDTSLENGQEVKIKITANKGSSNITLLRQEIDKDGEIAYIDSGVNTDYLTFERIITKGVSEIETWTFIVQDKNQMKDEITITFSLEGEITYQDIQYSGPIILGAQNNTSEDGFYSFDDNLTYTLAEAFDIQEKIQLLYFFDDLTGEDNVITGPGANIDESVYNQEIGVHNWTTRNTVRFIDKTDDITIEEFDACQNDSLILANTFEFSTGKRKAKNLAVDDIYSFVSEDQIEGLLKVININGEKEGTVEFELKWRGQ